MLGPRDLMRNARDRLSVDSARDNFALHLKRTLRRLNIPSREDFADLEDRLAELQEIAAELVTRVETIAGQRREEEKSGVHAN